MLKFKTLFCMEDVFHILPEENLSIPAEFYGMDASVQIDSNHLSIETSNICIVGHEKEDTFILSYRGFQSVC